VNKGTPGSPLAGIHWHAGTDDKVEYYATDPKRQDIPWMRVTNVKTGATKIFHNRILQGRAAGRSDPHDGLHGLPQPPGTRLPHRQRLN